MEAIYFTNLLVVVALAFLAPLLLGLAPRPRLPAVVLEIVAGIAVGPSGLGVAALLQATSLPFIVTATMVGQQLGVVSRPTAAGPIAAGLLSVVLFPVAALGLLRGERVLPAELAVAP